MPQLHYFYALCVAAWAAMPVSSATAGPPKKVDPAKFAALFPEIDKLADAQIKSGAVPALSIAVVLDDEVVYLKGFGVREAGKPEAVDGDTVFQLASVSKSVSSTVVAALVSDKLVSWDSKISDLDPAFRLHDPYPTSELTVRDLFAHRSGLPGSAGDDLEEIGFKRDEVLRRLRFVPASSSFRARYSYSNAGLTEGAVAAAKPTGKAWEDVAEEKLYRRLGMTSTSSRYADFVSRANRAALHVKVDGVWAAKFKRDADMQAPAGGVSSNARDMAQWVRLELANGMFGGEPIISSDALAETHKPLMALATNPDTGFAAFYALGWGVQYGRHGTVWGHAGAFSVGARTVVALFPDAKLGIVVLSNAFPTGVPEAIGESTSDLAFDGKIGKDYFTDWNAKYENLFGPAIEAAKRKYSAAANSGAAAMPLQAYVGTYNNDYLGDVVVTEANGKLSVKVGPGGATTFDLQHFDRDVFTYISSPELTDLPSAARFAVDAGGKASALTLESLDGNGLGTAERVE